MSVFIKICGLVSTDDAILINRFPVTFAGIVLFYPKSRRNRTLPEARSILEALRPDIKRVAVVVSPSVAEIAEIEKLDFDFIQIHGRLSDKVLRAANLPILKAFNVNDLDQYPSFQACDNIAGYVFDAQEPGSGKTFDLSILNKLPRDDKLFLLAGGLSPEMLQAPSVRSTPTAWMSHQLSSTTGVQEKTRRRSPILSAPCGVFRFRDPILRNRFALRFLAALLSAP